jgi:WD40 repeat protein
MEITEKEPNIDEFYVGRFTPSGNHLVVGGKLKDRLRWSEQDDDNHILPCPLKVFDLMTGRVVAKFHGHEEEILCIKSVVFQGENYLCTSSQDGYIYKWKLDETWTKLVEKTRMSDDVTCMAFTVSFLPNCGNKYFIGACDDGFRLYDFETNLVIIFNHVNF